MIRRADNKFFAAIAEGTQLATGLPAEGAVVTSANLPKGGVVVTDLGLVRLSEAALVALGASDQFMIVQGKGASKPLLKSEILTKGNIKITKHKYSAAVQQISAIGFNGTAGSLPAASDTSYFIKIRKNDNDAGNRSQPFSLSGQYKTSGSATQMEVAFGVANYTVINLADEATPYIDTNVLCDEAGVVATGTTTVFGVTYGSATVAIDGTLTLPVVGDVIRFAVGLDVPVYKVLAYTASGSILLDRPYTGATDAAVAIAGVRVVANATAVAAEFGITLTGIASPFDVAAFRNYYANRFTATFSDEDTLVSHLQGASNGTGVWQKVAMDEYMTYGYEGQNEMISTPPRARDQEVIEGAKYGAIEISWREGMDTLITTHSATGSVLLYCGLNASDQLPATTAAGKTADVLGAIAVPTFASTDLNE